MDVWIDFVAVEIKGSEDGVVARPKPACEINGDAAVFRELAPARQAYLPIVADDDEPGHQHLPLQRRRGGAREGRTEFGRAGCWGRVLWWGEL